MNCSCLCGDGRLEIFLVFLLVCSRGEGPVHHVLVLVAVAVGIGVGGGAVLVGVLGVHFLHFSTFGALWALAPFISCVAGGAFTPGFVGEWVAIIPFVGVG
jgi:hypothetical protein